MKVIGAGMGRTGTMSLKAALEQLLEGPCYHMTEVVAHPEHSHTWRRATAGEAVDWPTFLAGYPAGVDWPIAAFWRTLADVFPDARFILTVRDPAAWYRSVAATIWPLSQAVSRPPARWAVDLSADRAAFPRYIDEAIWGPRGVFSGRFEDRDHAISVFEAHNAEVRASLPADRLLTFDVAEGWGAPVRLPRRRGPRWPVPPDQQHRHHAATDPHDPCPGLGPGPDQRPHRGPAGSAASSIAAKQICPWVCRPETR